MLAYSTNNHYTINPFLQSINAAINPRFVFSDDLLYRIYDLRNRILLNLQLKIVSAGSIKIDALVTEINQSKNLDMPREMWRFSQKMLKIVNAAINQDNQLSLFLNTTLPNHVHREKICEELRAGNLDAISRYTGEKNLERKRLVRLCSMREIHDFIVTLPPNIVRVLSE